MMPNGILEIDFVSHPHTYDAFLMSLIKYLMLSCFPFDFGLHLYSTVLAAKNDSDIMFVYTVIKDLESIDHLCINSIRRIGLIHK